MSVLKMRRWTMPVGVVAVGLMLLPAAPATAAPWDWYTDFRVQTAHDAGYTGKGVEIAVIDGQINPDAPSLKGASLTIAESSCEDADGNLYPATSTEATYWVKHGTNVTSQIIGTGDGKTTVKGVAPGAHVTFYALTPPGASQGSGACSNNAVDRAFRQAVADGAMIISMSSATGTATGRASAQMIADALRQGVIVLQALPNETTQTDYGFANFSGTVAVGGVGSDAEPANAAVQYPRITVRGPGVDILVDDGSTTTGTSLATPIVAGMIALVADKYPNATGNQLLQTLILNTENYEHDLQRDEIYGYGIVNLKHMLDTDPTSYESRNPLVSDHGAWDGDITTADLADPVTSPRPTDTDATSSASTSSGDQSARDDTADESSSTPVWVWVAVGGAVVVIATIITIVVGVTRRRAAGSPPSTHL
jgi:subtilisin family serine protease